jgi:hypothetical protein
LIAAFSSAVCRSRFEKIALFERVNPKLAGTARPLLTTSITKAPSNEARVRTVYLLPLRPYRRILSRREDDKEMKTRESEGVDSYRSKGFQPTRHEVERGDPEARSSHAKNHF